MTLFFKSRTGREITLQPCGLNPTTLALDDFGESTPLSRLRKLAVGRLAMAKSFKRAAKLRKALGDDRVPQDLRNRIVDFAVKMSRQVYDPAAPGARGGGSLVKQRSDVIAEIISQGSLPFKLQQRLVQLVSDASPISIIAPSAMREGASPYPGDGSVYPGK